MSDEQSAALPGEPEQTTLTCECGEAITGPVKGRRSAAMQMGAHRWVKHGQRSDNPRRKRAGEPSETQIVERPGLSVVRQFAAGVGTNKRVPTTEDLAAGLGQGLALGTTFVASLLVEGDPSIPDGPEGDALREDWIENLSLRESAAKDLMHPIGRALAPTRVNQKYGRAVVDNVDVLSSVAELGLLAMQYRKYFRSRAGGQTRPAPAAPWEAPEAGAAGTGPVPMAHATPPPQNGRLVTSEDVQRLQAARAAAQ